VEVRSTGSVTDVMLLMVQGSGNSSPPGALAVFLSKVTNGPYNSKLLSGSAVHGRA
jgi:hypothetical protein